MRHILFLDPIEKLVPKKDSSILIALTFQQEGHEAYILFEDDFFVKNRGKQSLRCFKFSGKIDENFYVSEFKVEEEIFLDMNEEVVLHMRIDPPYDSRYQRYLWMQDFLKSEHGVKVVNDPVGIMKNSEKLEAYKRENSLPSYLGASLSGALSFINEMKLEGVKEFIFKPLDLYQGIGVEKVTESCDIEQIFKKKLVEYSGPVVIQPFEKSVEDGEIRSIYYQSKELGTILKTPKKGEFLANIAQGAKFERYEMSIELRNECKEICDLMAKDGVDFIAFDILGGKISEVNVTCPGLLVEVSSAMERNLAQDIVGSF